MTHAKNDQGGAMSPREMLEAMHQRRSDRYKSREAVKMDKLVPSIDMTNINPLPSSPTIRLSYEELRQAMFMTYSDKVKSLSFTPGQKVAIQSLIQYFIGDLSGELNLSKGIYLYGANGRGKSMLMRVIRDCLKSAYKGVYVKELDRRVAATNVRPFRINTYESIKDKVDRTGKTSHVNTYLLKDVCIDDIGYMNESKMNVYGTKIDLVAKIVKNAHNQWIIDKDIRYHFTSNLDRNLLQEMHGEGTYSRIVEMCNMVFWNGDNHRLS